MFGGRPPDSLVAYPQGYIAEDTLQQDSHREISYHLPVITVIGIRQSISRTLQPIRLEFDRWQTDEEVRWATGNLAGSFLKSYGGPGTLQSLSIGGGASAHTRVLMDGIPLNSPQSGGLDLSTLPLGLVGRIEYLPHGGSTLFSSAALSGVVNLTPKTPRTGVALTMGSYGHHGLQASVGWPGESAGVTLGQVSYGGDFPYTIRGKQALRENNQFQQRYLQARGKWARGGISQTVTLWLTQSERGVPGAAWDPNPQASQDDLWALGSATTTWSSTQGSHRWQLYGQEQQLHFQDPSRSINGKHKMSIGGSIYEYSRRWTSRLASLSRLEGRLERISSTDAGDHSRGQGDLVQQLLYQVTPNWAFLPVVRVSGVVGGSLWVTGDMALQLQPRDPSVLEQVTLVGSRNLRQPSFNDLYWIPGGKPDLRPEWSTMGGVKTRWHLWERFQLDVAAYHTRYTDLIQWASGEAGVWRPGNISAARASTWMATIAWSLLDGQVSLQAGWDGVFTENLEAGFNRGKPLRFTSPHAGQLQLEAKLARRWTIALMGSGRSSYLTYYDFPQDDTLPGKWTWNGLVRWVLGEEHDEQNQSPGADRGRGIATAFTLTVANLGNWTYETIPGYPEPGRTISLNVQIERK